MFHAIYYEEEIREHPRTRRLLEKYSDLPHIPCERYGEIFNRKAQNFRIQKQKPALILAKKHGNLTLPTPKGYGIGDQHNYYFSHMLNCIFDCRYCFLQGMYRSAHYVLFVNFEDFFDALKEKLVKHTGEKVSFFSGYDCDSLALEPVTRFVENSLPFFSGHPQATLELRTKSTQIQFLLKHNPLPNVVTAMTLTPKRIAAELEHRAPPLHRRLEALRKLQEQGWKIGLRLDPVIYCEDWREEYDAFYQELFSAISLKGLHSVSLGAFRVPRNIFKKMARLYPEEKLFAHSLEENQEIVSYKEKIEKEMTSFCTNKIMNHIPKEIFYPCCP
ncbi:SPL family radical SAM protein [Waddlia chondrophila]|uniref:Putative DNA repair photolyase n=1 Tax=Waddlia chondrophila (strain ATCC VR-1470 / WSU 86-1044) TaxID=716544 RepID=D6YTR2_WADCW|nr:deoxyribodipyrimidine photo-lyase [Waddlia chondrophila]ADI37523.1 putative DNA repair photolyase [Waddlia chondrophila WSU 86-1044]